MARKLVPDKASTTNETIQVDQQKVEELKVGQHRVEEIKDDQQQKQ